MKKLIVIVGLSSLLMAGGAGAGAVPATCLYAEKTCTFDFSAEVVPGRAPSTSNAVEYILISGSTAARAQFSLAPGGSKAVTADCSNVQIQAVDLTTTTAGVHPMYNYTGATGTIFCYNPAQPIGVSFDASDPHWARASNPLD